MIIEDENLLDIYDLYFKLIITKITSALNISKNSISFFNCIFIFYLIIIISFFEMSRF